MRRSLTAALAALFLLAAGLAAAAPASAAPASAAPASAAVRLAGDVPGDDVPGDNQGCPLLDGSTHYWNAYENHVFGGGTHEYSQKAHLFVRYNGNVILYDECGAERWAVRGGTPGAYMIMQGDGNLVIYNPDGSVVFATHTNGADPDHALGAYLVLDDNGELAIYGYRNWAWAGIIWTTGTAH
jgi:hypothetical protein